MGQSQTGGKLFLTGQGDSEIHSNSRYPGWPPTVTFPWGWRLEAQLYPHLSPRSSEGLAWAL